ncbi:MAG: flagellar biosynthesis protein FlhB [Myxococcota bacterium]
MADEDQAQKTEPATPRRREEARRKGQVAQSRELQNVAVLGAALLAVLSPWGMALGETMLLAIRQCLSVAAAPPSTLSGYYAALLSMGIPVAWSLVPIMAAIALAGALAQFAQTGPLWSLEVLQPKYERVDPLKGMKRLLNGDRLFDLVKSLFKVAAVGAVGAWVVWGDIPAILGASRADIASSLSLTAKLCLALAIALLTLLTLMAILDVAYQRWRYETRLRMSKKEVRDEMKEREGDPTLRGRFKAMHRDLSRSRMIAAVAEADVVVTNPTHYAVALAYDGAMMAAPKILAMGRDHTAARIREAAEEHDVPIVENPPLARVLVKTGEVGKEIPENLFQAVAEVLAYVYRLQPRRAHSWSTAP